jgi:spermidine synthase
MKVELLRDLDRNDAWLLLVDGSEQSYVDLTEPAHLEFEYVQHLCHVLTTRFGPGPALDVRHFGAGLCTVPRWIADRHPGSRQLVVEKDAEIAGLARSLGLPDGVDLVVDDIDHWLAAAASRRSPVDLTVVDVYSGPDTVTSPYALAGLRALAAGLRPGGMTVANLSDALPFDLARSAAAGFRTVWTTVAVVAEPPVLRGRRSGNVVIAGTDGPLDVRHLARRCAGGLVRGRVLAGEELREWIGPAVPAAVADQLPRSGELNVRRLR